MFYDNIETAYYGLSRLLKALPLSAGARAVGLAAAALAVVTVVVYLVKGYRVRRMFQRLQRQGLPMMPHHALLGHLPLMPRIMAGLPPDAGSLYLPLCIQKRWGDVCAAGPELPPVVYLDLWPLLPPVAMAMDGDVAAQFTQDAATPKPPETLRFMSALTANRDTASAEGAEWARRRKALSVLFSPGNINARVPELLEEVLVWRDALRARCGEGGAWGKVVQLEGLVEKVTLDVVNRFSLGVRLHDQTNEKMSALSSGVLGILSLQCMYLHLGNFWRYYSPWRLFKVWRYNERMSEFLLPLIRKRFDARHSTDEGTTYDLPRAMMKAAEAAGDRPDFVELAADIMGEAKLMVFAGHDTTTFTITSVFRMLAEHADVLARVRAEVRHVLGRNPAARLASAPHLLGGLAYTGAVIKETLRVHSNVGTLRAAPPGFALYGPAGSAHAGAVFPADRCLLWDASSVIHLHERAWPRPLEFLPQRWLGSGGGGGEDEEAALRARGEGKNWYRPFELGPRQCIGQHLATVEVKMVVALTVAEFDMECAWDEWDAVRGGGKEKPTVWGERLYMVNKEGPPKMKEGMPVRVRRRRWSGDQG